jgi:hypothetical protein
MLRFTIFVLLETTVSHLSGLARIASCYGSGGIRVVSVMDGLLTRSVAEAVKAPRPTPTEMRPLTPTRPDSY